MLTINPLIIESKHVSILVFVELALDDNRFEHLAKVRRGFQSLFSWNLLLMS